MSLAYVFQCPVDSFAGYVGQEAEPSGVDAQYGNGAVVQHPHSVQKCAVAAVADQHPCIGTGLFERGILFAFGYADARQGGGRFGQFAVHAHPEPVPVEGFQQAPEFSAVVRGPGPGVEEYFHRSKIREAGERCVRWRRPPQKYNIKLQKSQD